MSAVEAPATDTSAAVRLPQQRAVEVAIPPTVSHAAVLGRYVGYIGYFMGTALISGAVVHHPMDPSRYTKIAVAGVIVFMLATLYNEFVLPRRRPTPRELGTTMFMALLLSFGVGLLTGGLQHFEDFPERAAIMIPLGILLSFGAFAVKDTPQVWGRVLIGKAGAVVVVLAVGTFLALAQLAASIVASGGGGHDHSHGPAAEHVLVPPAADFPGEAPRNGQRAGEGHKGTTHDSAGHAH